MIKTAKKRWNRRSIMMVWNIENHYFLQNHCLKPFLLLWRVKKFFLKSRPKCLGEKISEKEVKPRVNDDSMKYWKSSFSSESSSKAVFVIMKSQKGFYQKSASMSRRENDKNSEKKVKTRVNDDSMKYWKSSFSSVSSS
jgi:hypothetical protein